MLRKKRAAKLIEEKVDGVSVDLDDEVTVRLDEDRTHVATIVEEDSPKESTSQTPKTRLEYVTSGPVRAKQKALRIKHLLSRRAR